MDEPRTWNDLTCLGATHLLDRAKTLILNSSQGKQPTGDHLWVEATLDAVETLTSQNRVLLTSVGLNTWELVCWAAGTREIPQVVGVPDFGDRPTSNLFADLLREFDLEAERTCAILFPANRNRSKSWWDARDKTLIAAADLLLPVAIREGGRIEGAIRGRSASACLDNRFRIPGSPAPKARPRLLFDTERIESEVDPGYEGWLTHWTRSADGPWPGETRADYYGAVATSRGEYSRSARRTLARIETERLLRASSWRIRDKIPAVSFTAASPSHATGLMRWRSRYARFTIEPFGVALHKDVACMFGVRPVVYLEDREEVAKDPAYLLQSAGSKGEWPLEQEYRHLGDLALETLPPDSWRPIELSAFLLENDENS